MTGEGPSFDTRAAAEAYCREQEQRDPDASWLPFEAEGRWTAIRTNLPRHEDPLGAATEAKPKPPQADDPRSAPARNVGPYVGP